MKLAEHYEDFRSAVADMANEHVAPIADEVDRTDTFPEHLIDVFADMGLIQLAVPEEYGGPGADLLANCIAREEIARAGSLALSQLSGHNGAVVHVLLAAGSEELKSRILPVLAQGRTITCIAITEEDGGSDPSALKTTAVRSGDTWVLNGAKQFITWGSMAKYAVVFARTNDAPGTKGITAFLVDTDQSGWIVAKNNVKAGQHGVPNNDIFLDGVVVPAENMIGEEGGGYGAAMHGFQLNRVTIAGMAVGAAQCAFDYAVDYARNRTSGGQRIKDYQGLRWMLADDYTRIAAARNLVYDAAIMYDQGGVDRKDFTRLAAVAKLFAAETVNQVTANAVQVLGGAGYMEDHPVSRYMRDAKLLGIYEGTNEVQKNIIAKRIFE